MRHIFVRLAILLSLVCGLTASAAGTHYSYLLLSPQDGYPSEVNHVFQEPQGFVWLSAKDGLYRLGNGALTKVSGSLSAGRSYLSGAVLASTRSNETLWTLSTGGVTGFTGTPFSSLDVIVPEPAVIAYSVITTAEGTFFGGENAVYRYDEASRKMMEVAHIPSGISLRITDMFVWLDGGIVLFDSNGNDIYMMYPKTGMVARFPLQCEAPGEFFSKLYIDSQFNIWASRHGCGVERYARDGSLIAAYTKSGGGLGSDLVHCFLENGDDIWVGTENGISIINRRGGGITVLKKTPSDPLSFPGMSITYLAKGEDDVIWAARNRGGTIIIHESDILAIRSEDIAGGVSEGVTAIYQDPDETDVWIGTEGAGLVGFNPESETLTTYGKTTGHNIYAISGYRKGQLLLSCASEGIFVFDKSTGEITPAGMFNTLHYRIRNGEKACLLKIDDNRVVALSDLIYCLNSTDGTIARYPLPVDVEAGTLHFVIGSEGRLLFDPHHIYRMDTESFVITQVLSFDEGEVKSASIAPDGSLWAIHGDNVLRIDKEDWSVREYQPRFEACRNPESLICAPDGNVWIGTRNVLVAFSPSEENLFFIDEIDGAFQNLYAPHAKLVDNSGNIYLGGINGFVKVSRGFTLSSGNPSSIELVNVIADGKTATGEVDLTAGHNSLRLDVIAHGDDVLRTKLFRFKVQGFGGTEEYEVSQPGLSIQNLPAGKYKVSASCTSREGYWIEDVQLCEFRVHSPWYHSFWFWSIVSCIMAGGVLLVYLITKRQRQMRQEVELQQSAIRGEEQRMNFLVDVSHELRTPLTLILGPLERMIRKNETVEPTKLVPVYRNAERIRMLLNTILTVEQIEDGKSAANIERHNINRWIRSVVANFEDEMRSRNLSLRLDLDPNLGSADIDASKCYIVISNILLNAIKVSPDGSTITIGTRNLEETFSYRVFVSDMGPGVKDETIGYLFDKYYTETEDKSGFGVGLSYSKAIVDSLNGTVSAYNNTPKKGATFYFDLPKQV